MQKYLCHICFDGRLYHGWQVQKDAVTVMEVFNDAINSIAGNKIDIKGCSRTDSGVSAKDYGVSFVLDETIPCEGLKRALNATLPNSILVKKIEFVPTSFHARYSSFGKRYVYTVLNFEDRDPFMDGMCYVYNKKKLDEKKLNNIAQQFVGRHDFSSFQNVGTNVSDTVREIYEFNVRRENDFVYFSVSGNGFLYNMVRIMVGTLIEGKENISEILESKDRKLAGFTAPACGLCLDKVFYEKPN